MDEGQRTSLTHEEKQIVIQGIIDTINKFMDRVVVSESPKKRAKTWSKPHKQSKTAIASNTMFFDNLTDSQRLPSRPRDFRLSLAERERNIGAAELSDILASMVNKYLLQNKRSGFPFPRGGPTNDLAEERKGRFSYYELPEIRKIIDKIIIDPKTIKQINNAILAKDLLYRFLKYSFKTHFHQLKENESAFITSMGPSIQRYGISYKKKAELDISWIYAKDLTNDKIKKLAEKYAIHTMHKLKNADLNILYTVASLFFFFILINRA
jgi:hypothetical protein